jgi:hypothetical protein
MEASWLLHHNTPDDDRQVTLYGVKGGAHWPTCQVFQSNPVTRQLYTTQLEVTGDVIPPHALECMEFARAIIEGAPSPVPAEQSLQVISILDAVYQSEITGHEVRLDLLKLKLHSIDRPWISGPVLFIHFQPVQLLRQLRMAWLHPLVPMPAGRGKSTKPAA